jgi:hypothetical protein
MYVWHVSYQFCGFSAEITVYAENEADTRPTDAIGEAVHGDAGGRESEIDAREVYRKRDLPSVECCCFSTGASVVGLRINFKPR